MAAVLADWPVARHCLSEAYAQRAPFLGYVDVEPAMAPLLEDPGCRALLERHGFGSDAEDGASSRAPGFHTARPGLGECRQKHVVAYLKSLE